MGNPCLAKGTRRVVSVKDGATGVERKVTMDGGDIGSFEVCDRVVQLVLAKDAYVRFSSFLFPFFSSFFSLPFLSLLLNSILPLFFLPPTPPFSFLPPPFFPVPVVFLLFFFSFSRQNLPTVTHAHTEYVNSNHAPSMASTNPPSSLSSPTVKSSSSSTSTTASSLSSCPPPP